MYLPAHFRSEDPALAIAIMRAHPLASLISVDDDGLPFVSHLPLHVQPTATSFGLLGHCARANPHHELLRRRGRAKVSFLGAHAYQSPRIYPDLRRVPSWNYLAVDCTVDTRLIDDAQAKDDLLKQLIDDHEPAYAGQWRGMEERFAQGLLAGIVGLSFTVTRWDCKIKLNQHRPESHEAMHALYAEGNAHERELAGWMERLGLHGAAS